MLKEALIAAREALEAAEALMIDMGVQSSDAYQEVEHALPLIESALAQTEQEPVTCGCGDTYPADSYGAGFMAATGHCENCEAAAPVAQPDLVEALKAMVENFEFGDMNDGEYAAIQKARAALAAAGEK